MSRCADHIHLLPSVAGVGKEVQDVINGNNHTNAMALLHLISDGIFVKDDAAPKLFCIEQV
jgi:hypothetical protein